MYNTLVLYTFVLLILFFLSLEIYKIKSFLKGEIIEFCDSNFTFGQSIISHVLVKLATGQIVKAEVEQCTMCMGHFSIGDEVNLIKSRNKYLVHLPLFYSKKNSCKNQRQEFNLN